MDLLNAAARVIVPVAVATIMFCLGLGLERDDFSRLWRRPRLLAVAAPCQLLLLPLLALLLAHPCDLPPALAAGLALVAACPVSAPANLLARLAGGNVAGSIALTALTAPAAAVTIPIALGLTPYQPGAAAAGPGDNALLWRTSFGVAAIAALPVLVGMLLRAAAPGWTRRIEPAAMRVAVVAFAGGLTLAIASCWDQIPTSFHQVGLAAVLLNVLGVTSAYGAARAARLERRERVVVMLVATTRQFAVAAFVALTLCRDPQLLVPAIAYCLIMWLAAGASVLLARLATPHGPRAAGVLRP